MNMNTVRRKIAKGMLVGVLATMLFPPFCVHSGGSKVYDVGFAFLFSSPTYVNNGIGWSVNIPLLLTEWLAMGLIWGILLILTRDESAPTITDRVLYVLEKQSSAKIEAATVVAGEIAEAAETLANARIESGETGR